MATDPPQDPHGDVYLRSSYVFWVFFLSQNWQSNSSWDTKQEGEEAEQGEAGRREQAGTQQRSAQGTRGKVVELSVCTQAPFGRV